MTETIEGFRNNCVLVAIKDVTGASDAAILKAVRKHGYKDNDGMFMDQYHDALADLGVRLGPVRSALHFEKQGYTRARGVTVKQVLRYLKSGVHIVGTRSHVFVVRDGVLLDHNYRSKPALGRAIRHTVEILNPHVPRKTGTLRLVRRHTRRKGTRTWRAYEEAVALITTHKLTRKQLLAACKEYDSIDLQWDIKRGNIVEA